MQLDESLQFPQIDNLSNTLVLQLAEYIAKRFSRYPYTQKTTADNIIGVVKKLSEEPEAKAALHPNPGYYAKAKNAVYDYSVGLIVTETPYHRLEHLRYFAAKATLFRDLTKKMMSVAQLATLSWTTERTADFSADCELLCTELREFFETTELLIKLNRVIPQPIKSTVFTGSVQGMIGGKKHSDLAEMIEKKILANYKEGLEKLINDIRANVAKTLKRKETESKLTIGMLSDSRLAQKETLTSEISARQFTNQHNANGFNLLHEAIRDNEPDKTLRCLVAGADPNLKTLETPPFPENGSKKPYRSPLCLAILDDSFGHRDRINLKVVELLLKAGAKVDDLTPKDARSLIHLCVFRKSKSSTYTVRPSPNLDLIRLLLSHQCDLNASGWEDFEKLLSDNKNTSEVATLLHEYVNLKATAAKGPVF